jgi:hypothetical protein
MVPMLLFVVCWAMQDQTMVLHRPIHISILKCCTVVVLLSELLVVIVHGNNICIGHLSKKLNARSDY